MENPNIPAPTPARRPFPTIGDLLAMLGIVLGVQIVVGLLLSVIAGFVGPDPVQPTDPAILERFTSRYVCIAYLASMSLGLTGVLLYRHRRGGTGRIVDFSTARLHPMLLLWSFVLLLAVGIVIEPLLNLLPDYNPPIGRGPWTVVMTVLFAPFFEELLCRGVILGSIRQRYGVLAAWLGSTLFFGILHMVPVLAINACVIGLILGYIYLATGSIWSSMLLHALNNAIAYVMLTIGGNRMLIDWIGNRTLYGILYVAALVIAGLSAWKMAEALRQMKEAEKNRTEA